MTELKPLMDARYRPTFSGIPLVGAFGNSWVGQSLSGNAIGAKGYVNCATSRLKGRARLSAASISGYPSQTSTTILSNINTFISSGADIGLVEMLINDPTAGVDYNTSKNNVLNTIQIFRDNGRLPIFGTVPPRSDANNTSAVRLQNLRMNDFLYDRMAAMPSGSMYVADVASRLTDRNNSVGAPYSGAGPIYNDGVHPTDFGAWAVSDPYFSILDSLLPNIDPYPTWRTTLFDRTNNPTGWIGNPSMYGTSGTITASTPAGAITGVLADGYTATRTAGSTLTATLSKVTGVNGGEYQSIVLGATGTGIAYEQIEITRSITGCEPGDVVQGIVDIEATNLSNVLAIYVYVNGTVTGLYRGMNDSGITGDVMPTAVNRWNRTIDIPVLANETLTLKTVIVGRCTGTAPTGTILIKSSGVRVKSTHP